MGLITLKKRAQFLRLRGGARWATAAFVLETKPRLPSSGQNHDAAATVLDTDSSQYTTLHQDKTSKPGPAQFGFTVTKRIGNAVTRNLIRRRLKEAVRQLLPTHAKPGHDYVLIARHNTVTLAYADLARTLRTALRRLHTPGGHKPGSQHAGPKRARHAGQTAGRGPKRRSRKS